MKWPILRMKFKARYHYRALPCNYLPLIWMIGQSFDYQSEERSTFERYKSMPKDESVSERLKSALNRISQLSLKF